MTRRHVGLVTAFLLLAAGCAHVKPSAAKVESVLEFRLVSARPDRGVTVPSWNEVDDVAVEPTVLFTLSDISHLEMADGGDDGKTPSVRFRCTEKAARRFEAVSGSAKGRRLAVILAGKVVATPKILHPISGGMIELTGVTPMQIETALKALAERFAAPSR